MNGVDSSLLAAALSQEADNEQQQQQQQQDEEEEQQQKGRSSHALVSELFLLTGKAKLTGICSYLSYLLNCSGTVVFAELFWVPGYLLQAEDRSHRIGSKHNSVHIHYLIGENTLDDAVYRQLQQKWGVLSNTLDGEQQQLKLLSCSKGSIPLPPQQLQQGSSTRTAAAAPAAAAAVAAEGDEDDIIEVLQSDTKQQLAPINTKQQQQQQQQQQGLLQFFKKARVE
ncbi:hypothetical protein EAH_00053090 [Eimeria acervulina]|uniref:Uncharacterized protein n=1 Tax=Eimeria acervulina TaxID=5801 RepID=U6GY06_EIMAC|nr:hypothetical protein EAH_00053090 [Eimeria acervulina]CDI84497.1 hypothetical protein EAH_00053090 [Eimeria acervulina]